LRDRRSTLARTIPWHKLEVTEADGNGSLAGAAAASAVPGKLKVGSNSETI
jgi:hypothetical protein